MAAVFEARSEVLFVAAAHLAAVPALRAITKKCGGVEGLTVAEENR